MRTPSDQGTSAPCSRLSRAALGQFTGCEAPSPKQKVVELNQKDSLASFRKAMLRDSSLEPKCLECNGILKCYCDILKEKRKKPYVCEDCGKSYRLQMYLLLHQKSHFREHLFKCSLCEKSFDKRWVLRKHMKTHQELTGIHPDLWEQAAGTPPGQQQKAIRTSPSAQQAALHCCKQCRAVFPSQNLLRIHSRDHKKTHSCLICGQVVQTHAALDVHLKGHRKPYECIVCGRISTNRPDFIAHQREHSGEQTYRCKVCAKGYRTLSGFIKHMNAHISQVADLNNAKADQSPPPIESKQELGGTVQYVFKKEEQDGTPLNYCPSMLKVDMDAEKGRGPSTLKVDMDSEKGRGPAMLKVDMDAEKGRGPSTLKVDMDAEKGRDPTVGVWDGPPVEFKLFKKGKRVTCKKCNKGFRYRESLRRHRDSHRLRFTCYKCGQAFCRLVKLYLHRHDHRTYRPYVCKHCAKTFSFRSLLLLHLNTHDPSDVASRYPCAYCRKVFRSQASCLRHHKTHVWKPAKKPTDSYLASFSNIQITPFSEHRSAEKRPPQETPPSKVYVKRLCYRPCV